MRRRALLAAALPLAVCSAARAAARYDGPLSDAHLHYNDEARGWLGELPAEVAERIG